MSALIKLTNKLRLLDYYSLSSLLLFLFLRKSCLIILTYRAILGVLLTHLILLRELVLFRKTLRPNVSYILTPFLSMPLIVLSSSAMVISYLMSLAVFVYMILLSDLV